MNAHPTPIEDAFIAAMRGHSVDKAKPPSAETPGLCLGVTMLAEVEAYVQANPSCHPADVAASVRLSEGRAKERLRLLFLAGRLTRHRESINVPYRYEVAK